MAFLLVSFLAFKQLLDMSSSSAFFTFIAREDRSYNFFRLYGYWVAIQLLISVSIILFFIPSSILSVVWNGEEKSLIILALIAVFFQNMVWTIASRVAEAARETMYVQKLQTVVVVVHLLTVILLWSIGKLAISFIFVALIIEWLLASFLAIKVYPGIKSLNNEDTIKSVFHEFWTYCLPFIPYVWLGAFYMFIERWMLQHWGGAIEQSYYAIAKQFGMVALLATSSILNIAWKEVAEAYHSGNLKKVELLYKKTSYILYLAGALTAGYLLPWASEILQLTVGSAYTGGYMAFMLMLLYPVHQSMGQIGGMMLLATGKTRLKVVLGIVTMLLGSFAAYFVMSPSNSIIPGLGLASEGLAWKMIIVQVIEVNLLAWFIARHFNWSFEWRYQVSALLTVLVLGWITKIMLTSFIQGPLILIMIASFAVYLLLLICSVYLVPQLIGINRKQLDSSLVFVIEKFKALK
jgi:O-antigen/teichoic acid export membrane protein